MALTGTEANIANVIIKLNGASKGEINREIGLSLDYIGYICRYLVGKGHIVFSKGRYYPAGAAIETPPNKSLAWEIADEVAKRIGINRALPTGRQGEMSDVKIKTEFDVPIQDESVGLESNIEKVGAKSEKEKFNIDKLIESLTRVRKGGK